MEKIEEIIQKYVKSLDWMRKQLLPMDALAKPKPVMGVESWDDAVCVRLGDRKIIVSVDGPYTKRLVLKSALIHASTDVVVKGGKPLFAMDALIGGESDVREMISSLRIQAEAMRIPILGGNTLYEEDAEPRCSMAVFGELLTGKPIRDSKAKKKDVVALIGEPIWGSQEERIKKAQVLFDAWFHAIVKKKVRVNSAKDVTKGGLVSVVYEMERKSGGKFRLADDIPYPLTRNLDNFIVTLNERNYLRLAEVCGSKGCPHLKIGYVE